jgi:hypothetical protein
MSPMTAAVGLAAVLLLLGSIALAISRTEFGAMVGQSVIELSKRSPHYWRAVRRALEPARLAPRTIPLKPSVHRAHISPHLASSSPVRTAPPLPSARQPGRPALHSWPWAHR